MMTRLIPCAVLGAALLLTGCGSERIQVQATMPATRVDLAAQGVKRIAVGDIKVVVAQQGLRRDLSSAAASLGEDLRAGLVNLRKFEILDRTSVGDLLKEHALNESGLVDGSTTVDPGKFTGATALVVGQITAYDSDQKLLTQRMQGGSGMLYQRKGNARLTASFKIIDVQTGKVMAVTSFADARSVTFPPPQAQTGLLGDLSASRSTADVWSSAEPPLVDGETLLAELRADAVATFIRSIAPYQVEFTVELAKDSDLPSLEQGNRSARVGDWADSEAQYRLAVAANPVHDGARFNLGVALRSQGKFDAALTELKEAYKLKDLPKYRIEVESTRAMMPGAAKP
jgi:curli biogenesis system outer membrane secretion channel CsgG